MSSLLSLLSLEEGSGGGGDGDDCEVGGGGGDADGGIMSKHCCLGDFGFNFILVTFL